MKNIILAAMVMMTVAGSAQADITSDWNYFWGTTLNPANTGWDEFFGTTLNPNNTGWNDFWYQCQDEEKTIGDCVGTVAAGIGATVIGPWLAISAVVVGASTAPVMTTVFGMTMMPAVASTGF